jgi:hypothetical protein
MGLRTRFAFIFAIIMATAIIDGSPRLGREQPKRISPRLRASAVKMVK